MENFTITTDQLEKVFTNLNTVISIKDSFEKEGDTLNYQKYLSEFCGYLSVIANLGLLGEWDKWRADTIRKEFEASTRAR